MQAIGNGESNESVLDTSMQKVKEFTSIAGEKLSTVNWKDYAKTSRTFIAWVVLGMAVITLFLFGHFLSCLYAIVVGLMVGIMEDGVIFNVIDNAVPGVEDVRTIFSKAGLSGDYPGALGVCYVFASIGFFTGSFTPLYFAGLTLFASGVVHLLSLFYDNQNQYEEMNNSATDNL